MLIDSTQHFLRHKNSDQKAKASSENNMYIFMIRKMYKPPSSPFRNGDEGGLLLKQPHASYIHSSTAALYRVKSSRRSRRICTTIAGSTLA